MSPAAAPVPAGTRRAWAALCGTGTVLLIAGLVTVAAGEVLASGSGARAAVTTGKILIVCGLLCGVALLAVVAGSRTTARQRRTAETAAPGSAAHPDDGAYRDTGAHPEGEAHPGHVAHPGGGAYPDQGAYPEDEARTGRGGYPGGGVSPAGQDAETSEEWLRSLRPGGPSRTWPER